MLSKCSNPTCTAHFLYLHAGRIFRFDARSSAEIERGGRPKVPKGIEFFWLCEKCAAKFTLVADAAEGARVVSIPLRALRAAAAL
jgi:hypothetical protein